MNTLKPSNGRVRDIDTVHCVFHSREQPPDIGICGQVRRPVSVHVSPPLVPSRHQLRDQIGTSSLSGIMEWKSLSDVHDTAKLINSIYPKEIADNGFNLLQRIILVEERRRQHRVEKL